MSFVLRELRIKAKVVEGVLDVKDNNLQVIQSAKRRASNRGSFQLDNAASLFAKIKHYHHDSEEGELLPPFPPAVPPAVSPAAPVKVVVPKDDEDHSSGDTSGPDSPHHSTDEYDETEMVLNDEFARCHLTKEMELENQNIEYGKEAMETNSAEPEVTIPEIQVEASATPNKEGGQLGSKWKLLKTLKERKAEEKSNQTKTPVEPQVEKDKVSMLGMMQKFYEIHVKT